MRTDSLVRLWVLQPPRLSGRGARGRCSERRAADPWSLLRPWC